MNKTQIGHWLGKCSHSSTSRLAGYSSGLLLVLQPFAVRAAESTQATTTLERLAEVIAGVMGDWTRNELFSGLTWGELLLSVIVLALTAVVAHGLQWVLRRVARSPKARQAGTASAEQDQVSWFRMALVALIPPLTVFIWIWGVYAAWIVAAIHVQTLQGLSLLPGLLSWLKNAGEIAALFWFLFRMIQVVEVRLRGWTKLTQSKWDDVLVVLVVRALRLLVPLVGVILVVPTLNLPESSTNLFKQVASLMLIGAIGFILYQLICAVEEAVLSQFRIDVKDNLEARKVYTQVKVLKKIAVVVIILFTASSMLMVFDSVRQLGTSLLASAGVLGIIVGFAAQRSIATVLAGFQIAMTQPIRLDDVVIVEGEWGRIEEITLTYVVVLIWDQRRLVVPISYFIEKPFQNWTRISADLLGSVFLHVDYTVPLQALRVELDRLLEGNERWDRKVKVVQVTDTKPACMEVRVLVSAADAGTAWDLRCELREKLIDFLQKYHPTALPRMRAELQPAAPESNPAAA